MLGMQMLRVLLTYDVAKGKGAVYADAACVADICLLLCLSNAVVGAVVLGAVAVSALAECSCSDECCCKCCCCRMYSIGAIALSMQMLPLVGGGHAIFFLYTL